MKTKEQEKRDQYKYNRKLKQTIFNHYGHKCQCCNETRYEFLVIDHINKDKKIPRKSGKVWYIWIIKNKFPNNLRILCHNCNMALAFFGYCPHEKEAYALLT